MYILIAVSLSLFSSLFSAVLEVQTISFLGKLGDKSEKKEVIWGLSSSHHLHDNDSVLG